MTRARLVVLACLASMVLAGCGDAGSPTAGSPTAGSPSTGPAATPAASATSAAGAASGGVSAGELCDYLRGELPELRKEPGEIDAMARLATGLSGWYDERGAVPDGTQIDELTRDQCADVRAEVLKLAGVQSFLQI
ncbi:hypothetical protein AB0J20_00500 [Micromonospora costi]|uniref:hypothetical protein n=1 Tax=Micromonospora costi TaxID=1530042 RepID=UPI00340E6084